jgi:hypothetical protein
LISTHPVVDQAVVEAAVLRGEAVAVEVAVVAEVAEVTLGTHRHRQHHNRSLMCAD